MADACESLVARIRAETATIGGGPWNASNVFAGPLRPESGGANGIPRKAIFVANAGGLPPWMRFGSGGNVRRQECTIYVRGEAPDTLEATRDVADGVWTAVHRCTLSGFINCVCVSDVLFLTTNPTDLPLYSMRVQVWLDA